MAGESSDTSGGMPAPGQSTAEPVTGDVGGVQGSTEEEMDDREDQVAQTAAGEGRDVAAPDAGEIEWAGEVVKKAPGKDD